MLFIEPANLLENITPGEETGGRDGAVVARHLQLAANSGRLRGESIKGVLHHSAHPEHHPRMLDRLVPEKQARTDRADFRPLHMLSHRGQPIVRDDFGVVV